MRDYAKVCANFWCSDFAKSLRGEPEAQVVALYLLTCPSGNMLGLFYLPVTFIAHETGLTFEGASKGLRRVSEGASKGLARGFEGVFCCYDEATECVWLVDEAETQVASYLDANDKRCKGVQNAYNALPSNPFLPLFFDRYGEKFNMSFRREFADKNKPLASPFEAPSKPEAVTVTVTEAVTEAESATEAGTKTRAVQSRKTPLPENFAISDSIRAWAASKGHGRLEAHFDSFVSKAQANGYTYVNWEAALRNAIQDDWARLGKPKQDRIEGINYGTEARAM